MFVIPGLEDANELFAEERRLAIAKGTVFRLMDRHPVYLEALNGGGERFAGLFRETWRRIPLGPRRAILGHWRTDLNPLVLIGPAIRLCDHWPGREAPRRTKGDKGLRGDYGVSSANGHRLCFWTKIVDAFPDNLVRDLIAHELAHVYQSACGYADSFNTPYECEEDADFRMEAWGFSCDAMDEWATANGIRRVINLDELSPADRARHLKAAERSGR